MRRRTVLASGAAAAVAVAGALPSRFAIGQNLAGTNKLLRYIPTADLSVLDPSWTTTQVSITHGYYVFDTLFGLDSSQTPRPQMAERADVSDDGRTWTIRLREGLRFHDNEPVLARDAAASLRRWAARDVYGQTVGAVVEEWGAADDRTIRIKLTVPFPLMLDALAKPNGMLPVVMPERLANTDLAKPVTEMVGSGPYRFLKNEFVPGSSGAYEKFAGYVPRTEKPDWASGGKVAHIERVEWRIINDPSTASAALQKGEVDCWGGRPHGIECQNWVVTNQYRSRPCPKLSASASTRPKLFSPFTASRILAERYCKPISVARRWRASSRSFPPPRSSWKHAAVHIIGRGNSAPLGITFA